MQEGEAPINEKPVLIVSKKVSLDYEHHQQIMADMRAFSCDGLVRAYQDNELPASEERAAEVFCRRLLQVFIPQKMAWGYKRTTHGYAIGHVWYTNRQQAMQGENCDLKNMIIFQFYLCNSGGHF